MDTSTGVEGLCDLRLVQEGDREGWHDNSARYHQSNDAEDEQQTRRAGGRLSDKYMASIVPLLISVFDGVPEISWQQQGPERLDMAVACGSGALFMVA